MTFFEGSKFWSNPETEAPLFFFRWLRQRFERQWLETRMAPQPSQGDGSRQIQKSNDLKKVFSAGLPACFKLSGGEFIPGRILYILVLQ